MEYSFPATFELPGYKPTTKPHHRQIAQAVELIAQAEKPVIYAGGGVIKAEAAKELREFAEFSGIPVVTTLMALGGLPGISSAPHGHAGQAWHRPCSCGDAAS